MNTLPKESARIREIAVSRWWNGTDLSTPLETVDGRIVRVVFRGNWSHGLGPDFQGAMLDFGDGHLLTGDIEIHLETAAWRKHDHHLDPRYNDVILHLVLDHDDSETRRADGKLVPVVRISPDPELLGSLQAVQIDWNITGGVCAPTVSRDNPQAVREILWQLGDRRLARKVEQFETRFEDEYPADVLFETLMDGLGYSSNRDPMCQLAMRLPVRQIDALLAVVEPEKRWELALGLLLGTGGFLPLAPADADLLRLYPDQVARVETSWMHYGGPWHHDRLPPTAWNRTRVRPANHPLVRLGMAAALLTSSFEGLTAALVDVVRRGEDPVRSLIAHSTHGERASLGRPRAIALVANAVLPFLLALAESTHDLELSERTSYCWEYLEAGEPNRITRRALQQVAGKNSLGRLGERGLQGLIELDRHFCEPRRYLECPIALLELEYRSRMESATLE